MSDLPKVRAALDRIDAALLDLLAERSAVVDEVAALKSRDQDLFLRDLERERDLLSRVGPRGAAAGAQRLPRRQDLPRRHRGLRAAAGEPADA